MNLINLGLLVCPCFCINSKFDSLKTFSKECNTVQCSVLQALRSTEPKRETLSTLIVVNEFTHTQTLFLYEHPSVIFLICHTFQLYSLTAHTSVDVHIGTSCCWKNKGSTHLQGSLLFERRKQKQYVYPTVLPASVRPKHAHGRNSYRQWCSLVSTQHRHCLDERCVLMRALWEFNEARTMGESEAMDAYWCKMFLGDPPFFMCWIPCLWVLQQSPCTCIAKVTLWLVC